MSLIFSDLQKFMENHSPTLVRLRYNINHEYQSLGRFEVPMDGSRGIRP